MKNYFKILLLAVAAIQVGCFGTIICPDIKESSLAWTPYEQNDTILYTNKATDSSIALTFSMVEIKHTTQYNSGADCGEGCKNQIIANGDLGGQKFEFLIELEKNNIQYQSYMIKDTYFTSNFGYFKASNYLFENIEYDDVTIFNSESNKSYKMLVIAKGIGIVGFVDSSDNVWSIEKESDNPPIDNPTMIIDSTTVAIPIKAKITNTTGC